MRGTVINPVLVGGAWCRHGLSMIVQAVTALVWQAGLLMTAIHIGPGPGIFPTGAVVAGNDLCGWWQMSAGWHIDIIIAIKGTVLIAAGYHHRAGIGVIGGGRCPDRSRGVGILGRMISGTGIPETGMRRMGGIARIVLRTKARAIGGDPTPGAVNPRLGRANGAGQAKSALTSLCRTALGHAKRHKGSGNQGGVQGKHTHRFLHVPFQNNQNLRHARPVPMGWAVAA